MEGQSTICTGATDPTFGFLNTTDPNYKALVAMILMAQAAGKSVTLYTIKSASGYCQIAFVSMPT